MSNEARLRSDWEISINAIRRFETGLELVESEKEAVRSIDKEIFTAAMKHRDSFEDFMKLVYPK